MHPVLNYLGRSQFPADPLFKGYLDDVRIYNYALSADAVRQAMDDIVNGIDHIPSATDALSAPQRIYNAAGQQRSRMQRGLNIVGGGKKVLR